MEGTFDRYFEAVSRPDPAEAAAVLDEALTRGMPVSSLITEVLARAQSTAGEKWMRGEWTIADEHAVTAVTKQALTMLAPPRSRPAAGLHVVVACAPGEWHSLPARMAGALLQADDLEVSVLGAGMPLDQVRQYLRSSVPDVLALSATMPTSLVGAARTIAAARAEGVPVVVGGGAWGTGQHRARALGADLRLDDIREIRERIAEVRATEPPPLPEIPAEACWLEEVPRAVVADALDRHLAEHPVPTASREEARAEGHRELRWIAQHVAASLATDDPSVSAGALDWLLSKRAARGLPPAPVLAAAGCLADAVAAQAPRGAALLRREVDAARARSGPAGPPSSADPA